MLLQDVAMETNNDRQMDMAMQRRLIHIGRRDICAGLIGAGITAIIVGFIGVGPWRYQAIQADRGCYYFLDTWSGRARLWIGDEERSMRTVRQQRRDLAARIRAVARRERDGDTECYVVRTGGYRSVEVLVAPQDLDAFLRAHPTAEPVK